MPIFPGKAQAEKVEKSGEGLFFVSDMEGRTIFASDAVYAFCGRPEGSANGLAWRGFIHPDDLSYVSGLIDAATDRRESFAAWWRIVRNDGAYAWILCGGSPLISEITGLPFAYMGSIYPLKRPDAFARAGGVTGPEPDGNARTGEQTLHKVERIADMALMAAALARESGESGISDALDEALARIGFRLAQLTRHRDAGVPPGAAARRPARQRRRLATRG